MNAHRIIRRPKSGRHAGALLLAFIALWCFFCAVSARSEPETKDGPKPGLRVLTYNVFVGFKNDDKRHERAVAWIAAQEPEVVALQELNNYTDEKLKEDARVWGHPHAVLCKVKSGFHLGLTSRKPIEDVHLITTEGLWHGVIHGRTYGIDFFVLHLAPKPEVIRLPETQIVLDEIRKIHSADRPGVLIGDFNSASRLDHDFYERNSKHKQEYNVMDLYLNGGWVDLVHQHHGTMTEKQATMPTLLIENKWGFWRIDYILASGPLAKKCVSARTMKSPATDYIGAHK